MRDQTSAAGKSLIEVLTLPSILLPLRVPLLSQPELNNAQKGSVSFDLGYALLHVKNKKLWLSKKHFPLTSTECFSPGPGFCAVFSIVWCKKKAAAHNRSPVQSRVSWCHLAEWSESWRIHIRFCDHFTFQSFYSPAGQPHANYPLLAGQ